MQIVSNGDNLNECQILFPGKNKKKKNTIHTVTRVVKGKLTNDLEKKHTHQYNVVNDHNIYACNKKSFNFKCMFDMRY